MDPFAQAVESGYGLNSTFYELPGHPDLFVRSSDNLQPDPERIARAKKLFQDLEERGVAIVPTEYVIGHKKGQEEPVVYAVSERLKGESLERMESFGPEIMKDLDTFYSGYLSHVQAAYAKQTEYVFDFHYAQCMDATRPGSEESKVYFVDVEPRLATFDPTELQEQSFPGTPQKSYLSLLWRLSRQIREVEKKSADGLLLEQTRESLNNLLDQELLQTEPAVAARIRSIQGELA
jgi:hypothetical protein